MEEKEGFLLLLKYGWLLLEKTSDEYIVQQDGLA
jgi:hypothetical protein